MGAPRIIMKDECKKSCLLQLPDLTFPLTLGQMRMAEFEQYRTVTDTIYFWTTEWINTNKNTNTEEYFITFINID